MASLAFQDLSSILSMLSANDTNVIKQGEKQLKAFNKRPEFIVALLQQIRTPQNEANRLHAALLLKKIAPKLYAKLSVAQKAETKAHFMGALLSEESKPTGIAIAGAVAALAKKVLLGKNPETWPELFSSISTLAQDPSERLKTLNFSLLAQVSIEVDHIQS